MENILVKEKCNCQWDLVYNLVYVKNCCEWYVNDEKYCDKVCRIVCDCYDKNNGGWLMEVVEMFLENICNIE